MPRLRSACLHTAMLLLALCALRPAWAQGLPPRPPWDQLKAAYAYDAGGLTVTEQTLPDPAPGLLLVRFTFTNQQGQQVPGLFLRPRAPGVYPCALLLHGAGNDKATMITIFGPALAARGIACLALDAVEHGERNTGTLTPGLDLNTIVTVGRGTVLDYRLALDYLQTRPDVDSTRVGLLGYSMGALMGAILGGVDARVTAALLLVGGDPIRPHVLSVPPDSRFPVEAVSPSNFIGHMRPRPVLMINGIRDTTIPLWSALYLYSAANYPKSLLLVPSGHILPEPPVRRGADWLIAHLTRR